ncbi:hypothetical protein DICPUDRAFT_82941 [Dictyostelium purpureum]|uniref:Uncharacterized protein n=1 Tax=Dictyostelium purpureum TaxID=5786 RepID=F0ZY30_DICPU|nr:uncharacterized protein DICPUDRAFT_82941 [Dictyostelium purpureum]EGC31158.1 hypothetical protein DICPUDRAFT_82941 [Dictyostelium purpureum]|eukprot:XP_003292324.1 hypothetical protein DICPUDRAFT_82941 [Dictyostelium purpureum]
MNCIENYKQPYQISDKIIILGKNHNNNNNSSGSSPFLNSNINNKTPSSNTINSNPMDNHMCHFLLEKNNNNNTTMTSKNNLISSNNTNNNNLNNNSNNTTNNLLIQNNNNENYFNQIKNNPNSGLFFNFKANINNDNYPTVCAHKSICLICNRDIPPCLSSRSVSWVSILRVVFYSLKNLYPEKEYFNLKKDVYGYVATHWSLICTKKKKTPGWRKQLQDALSHCRRLFESGADHHECYGFWKLKDMSDPWEDNTNNSNNNNNNNTNNNNNHIDISSNNNINNTNNNVLTSSGNNIINNNGSPFSSPSSPQMVYTSPVLSLSNNSSPNYNNLSQSNSITTTPLLGSTHSPSYLTTSSNSIRNGSRYSPNLLNNSNNINSNGSVTPNSLISTHHSRNLSNSINGFTLHSSSTSSTPSISSGLLSPQSNSSANPTQYLNINNYINDLSNLGISSPVLTNTLVSRPRSKSLGNSLFQLDSPTTKPQIINNENSILTPINNISNNINLSSSFNNMIQYAKTKRSNSQQYYPANNLKSIYRPEKLPKLHEDFNSDYNILNQNSHDHQVVPNDNNTSNDKVSISNLLNNSTDSFEDSPPRNNNSLSNSDIIFKFSRKRSFDLT